MRRDGSTRGVRRRRIIPVWRLQFAIFDSLRIEYPQARVRAERDCSYKRRLEHDLIIPNEKLMMNKTHGWNSLDEMMVF